MTTPNLDATLHCWVESLVGFTFSIEYHKGQDNAATGALSPVTLKLDAEAMKSILDGFTMGTTGRVEIHKQVRETAVQARAANVHVSLYLTDWVATQQGDPILKTVIEWTSEQKVQDLKHLLGDTANMEEWKAVLGERKKLTLYQGALYHCHTVAGELEEVLQSVVPVAHWVAAMNGCHWDAGY